MQFRLASGFVVFLGSYFPLAFILAIQDIPSAFWDLAICTPELYQTSGCTFLPFQNPTWSISFMAISGVAIWLSRRTLKIVSYPHTVTVKSKRAIPNEVINYTFPYVVSFMGMSYDDPQKLLGFFAFLLWMFTITYKSGQILMNPLLLLFGWRLYEGTIGVGSQTLETVILHQGNLEHSRYNAQKIQEIYILEKGVNGNGISSTKES